MLYLKGRKIGTKSCNKCEKMGGFANILRTICEQICSCSHL
nr:MAG TPA: hypothetical protein [Caudoviricetes sp.]